MHRGEDYKWLGEYTSPLEGYYTSEPPLQYGRPPGYGRGGPPQRGFKAPNSDYSNARPRRQYSDYEGGLWQQEDHPPEPMESSGFRNPRQQRPMFDERPMFDPRRRGGGPGYNPMDYEEEYEEEYEEPQYPGPVGRRPRYTDKYKPATLPRELTDMFGALECRLCGVEVGSPIVAKMHYSGKQHIKKVKSYLTEWCMRTGRPMPDVEGTILPRSANTLSDYCEVCEVRLISVNDKLLHYSGRIHLKNERDPANARKRKRAYEVIDTTGRFGIGSAFGPQTEKKSAPQPEDEFVCLVCDVKAVSQEQLDAHLNGKKHKEKLEKKSKTDDNDETKPERPFQCSLCNVSLETFKLYQLHIHGKKHIKNMLKTDMENAGANYCEICAISFSSWDMYQSHIQGKKHEKKCRLTFNTSISLGDEKFSLACEFCPFVGNPDKHKCDRSLANIKEEDLENKIVCKPCHNMVFDTEEEFNEHQQSRRHVICVLNQETGDKVVETMKHWYCFVCKKQSRSHKEYTDHLFEEKHLSLSNAHTSIEGKTDLYRCTVCNIVMDQLEKEAHKRDRKHLKMSLKSDTMTTLTKLANEEIVTTTFHCSNCNVYLNSFMNYSEHLLSEAHMDVMINARLKQIV